MDLLGSRQTECPDGSFVAARSRSGRRSRCLIQSGQPLRANGSAGFRERSAKAHKLGTEYRLAPAVTRVRSKEQSVAWRLSGCCRERKDEATSSTAPDLRGLARGKRIRIGEKRNTEERRGELESAEGWLAVQAVCGRLGRAEPNGALPGPLAWWPVAPDAGVGRIVATGGGFGELVRNSVAFRHFFG
jgi:hypothetical protein